MRRRLVVLAAALVSLALAAPAEAVHPAPVANGSHGVKLQHAGTRKGGPGGKTSRNTLSVRSSASTGVVSPNPTVYLVFWGSQWASDPAGAAAALQSFFTGLNGTSDNWGPIMNQYCEGVAAGTTTCGSAGIHIQHPTSSILGGAWFDNASAAPSSATSNQIGAEAVRAAAHFNNTTQAPNLNAQYVIASASGTHPDNFPNSGFCAWHSSTTSNGVTYAFTNLPYVPDLGTGACTTLTPANVLDGYFSTETHEYAETVTDFFPSAGWNGRGGEIGDECVSLDRRITLSTGTFDVQGLWSNSANACVTTG